MKTKPPVARRLALLWASAIVCGACNCAGSNDSPDEADSSAFIDAGPATDAGPRTDGGTCNTRVPVSCLAQAGTTITLRSTQPSSYYQDTLGDGTKIDATAAQFLLP